VTNTPELLGFNKLVNSFKKSIMELCKPQERGQALELITTSGTSLEVIRELTEWAEGAAYFTSPYQRTKLIDKFTRNTVEIGDDLHSYMGGRPYKFVGIVPTKEGPPTKVRVRGGTGNELVKSAAMFKSRIVDLLD
jgi:hypothetical protein